MLTNSELRFIAHGEWLGAIPALASTCADHLCFLSYSGLLCDNKLRGIQRHDAWPQIDLTALQLSWYLHISQQIRNPLVLHNGDVYIRCYLFFSMFLPLGASRLRARFANEPQARFGPWTRG